MMNKFGRYEIVEKIGQGSMGNVYRGFDPQIKREIALKVLREDQLGNDYFVKRFLKEAMAIGRLSHPNIVTIYDVGEDQNTIYIVMELLTGKPLNEVMKETPLSREDSLNICIKAAQALHYAHGKGVVHRDVKTTNIMISGNTHVTLTDFGIAHFDDPQMTNKTQAGEILGTPAFMSPEQVAGKPVDGRSDLFSLGVILYELVTGKRPFTGNNLPAVFEAIMKKEPERPSHPEHYISPELEGVIMKSLKKEPSERFQSGDEMAGALLQCLEKRPEGKTDSPYSGSPIQGNTPPDPTGLFLKEPSLSQPKQEPPAPVSKGGFKKNLIIIGLIGFIGLIVLSGTGYYMYIKRDATQVTEKQDLPLKTIDSVASSILAVSTQPEGAQVYIDGKYYGKTPARVRAEYGRHEVLISLDRYFDQEFQLTVDQPEITLSRRMIPEE